MARQFNKRRLEAEIIRATAGKITISEAVAKDLRDRIV
jgi:hypothetical protein